jgi:hypothetical protein
MATIRNVHRQIFRCEKFRVQFRNKTTGKAVRGNLAGIPSYHYQVMAKNKWSVNEWIEKRFNIRYPGFDVYVLQKNGDAFHGGALLSNVRNTYSEE